MSTEAILRYTMIGVAESESGLNVQGKEYRFEYPRLFAVRPLIGETVQVNSDKYKITEITHDAEGLALVLSVGYHDFTYPYGKDPDRRMPKWDLEFLWSMISKGWMLLDEHGKQMSFAG